MAAKQQTLGERIQALRLAAGLSQSQLARAARVPIGTLKNWEQDQAPSRMASSAVVTLAEALGIAAGPLLEGVSFPTVEAPGRAGRPRKPAAAAEPEPARPEQPAAEPKKKRGK